MQVHAIHSLLAQHRFMNKPHTEYTALQQEWQTLQHNHESYEFYALGIKLFSIALCAVLWLNAAPLCFSLMLIALLWLQEGIFKTFQSRLADRLLNIEQHIAQHNPNQAFQLYSDWQQHRPSSIQLIQQYLCNALRPTVAYPYCMLLIVLCVQHWIG